MQKENDSISPKAIITVVKWHYLRRSRYDQFVEYEPDFDPKTRQQKPPKTHAININKKQPIGWNCSLMVDENKRVKIESLDRTIEFGIRESEQVVPMRTALDFQDLLRPQTIKGRDEIFLFA